MAKYKVNFYKGSYKSRQEQANKDKCVCYVEHHFNSAAASADYSLTVVAANASETSKKWGKLYTKTITEAFGTKAGGDGGILVGGYKGRGNANLVHTAMPAILVEPMFVSNPGQAKIVKSEQGQQKLAQALVDSIITTFPKGGTVAFSVGHKYKTGGSKDLGAAVHGGGMEADYAEAVLLKAQTILEAV